MALERTFSILKPDATARNLTGAINAMIEQAGLRIVAQKRVRITPQARNILRRPSRTAVLRRPGGFHDFGTGGGAGARRRQRHRESTATSWAPPIPPRLRRAPSERCTPNRSARIPCTVPMRPTPRRRRSCSSFPENEIVGCALARIGRTGGFTRADDWIRPHGSPWSAAAGATWVTPSSGSRSSRSCGSTSCCRATTPWSLPWPAAACRSGNGCGA